MIKMDFRESRSNMKLSNILSIKKSRKLKEKYGWLYFPAFPNLEALEDKKNDN